MNLAPHPKPKKPIALHANYRKLPEEYSYGSDAQLWWQCPHFPVHVYPARISSCTTSGTGCPSCATSGRPNKVQKGRKRAKVIRLDRKRPRRAEKTRAPSETG